MRSLRLAFSFLTRFPAGPVGGDVELSRALPWFPAVGFVLGAGLAGLAWALAPLGEPLVAATVLVAWHALATGGLHLDGVADWFDAADGGRGDRVRMLAIMRDPHVGAHGVAGLCLVLVAKVALFAAMLDRADAAFWVALPGAARAAAVLLVAWFPAVRPDGLGRSIVPRRSLVAVLAALAWMAGAVALAPTHVLLAGVAGAFVVALAVGGLARSCLGGVTGDIHGAAIELGEAAFAFAGLVAHAMLSA